MNTRKLQEQTATKMSGKLLAAILAVVLGAFVLTGCGGPRQDEVLLLANIGWDENVAVSHLTKVLLEDELDYESVEVRTSEDLDMTYRDVASGELDAFQDVWLPNQQALLEQVSEDTEHLDPWFLGETKQGMAVPAYMDVKSIDQLNGTDAQLIFGIEPSSVMMHKVGENVMPAYGLKQKLVEESTASMLDAVERLTALREDFVFLAWSPHWMNQRFDIRYLEDPTRWPTRSWTLWRSPSRRSTAWSPRSTKRTTRLRARGDGPPRTAKSCSPGSPRRGTLSSPRAVGS